MPGMHGRAGHRATAPVARPGTGRVATAMPRRAERKAARRRARVARALDGACRAAPAERVDLATLRMIVFSDHHRGGRDGADDFRRCERAYNAALAHYFESGYRLVLLGDVEELWECRASDVLGSYARTYGLEAEFARAGRYQRVWGNHDDEWSIPRRFAAHRDSLGGPGVAVHEAIRMEVVHDGASLGELFLVHGHQGTDSSDRFRWISRLIVRRVWRPLQRRLRLPSTTPATDWDLREQHDEAMFSWAAASPQAPLLIAGHTHRPVFGVGRRTPTIARPVAELEREYEDSRSNGATREELARLRAEIEFGHAEPRRHDRPPIEVVPPCYFNTGCCSFGDGDVTGLELADGRIRLVRWLDDEQQPAVKMLADASLASVLRAVRERAPVRIGEAATVTA
jgi:hypothetical protein